MIGLIGLQLALLIENYKFETSVPGKLCDLVNRVAFEQLCHCQGS